MTQNTPTPFESIARELDAGTQVMDELNALNAVRSDAITRVRTKRFLLDYARTMDAAGAAKRSGIRDGLKTLAANDHMLSSCPHQGPMGLGEPTESFAEVAQLWPETAPFEPSLEGKRWVT